MSRPVTLPKAGAWVTMILGGDPEGVERLTWRATKRARPASAKPRTAETYGPFRLMPVYRESGEPFAVSRFAGYFVMLPRPAEDGGDVYWRIWRRLPDARAEAIAIVKALVPWLEAGRVDEQKGVAA